ncbi:MAG: hypothetical protein ACLQBD_14300 [Syntrophobacteraceae bacterium]
MAHGIKRGGQARSGLSPNNPEEGAVLTTPEKLVRHKSGLLELAECLDNV